MYIELHPTHDTLILEASGSCGGTWAEDRLYPRLKSNNLLGTYEYPDFPMSEERYGVKTGEHIPGPVLHRYLTDYAKRFGVFDRTQFNTKVEAVERRDTGGWKLTTSSEKGQQAILTRKVILATGLTSTPNVPTYPGAETFGAPIFHAKEFCRQGDTTMTAKNVVVIGGAKSAFDVAYAYLEAGAEVDLVIRPNGNGPVWISPPWVMGGKKQLEKLLHTRVLTWFSPCPWEGEDGWFFPRRFLHGTAVGRWVVDKFWATLTADVVQLIGYNTHPETKKLLPWNSAFWIGSALGIHNYDSNFFEFAKKGQLRIHVANVDHLSEKTVHLSTGEALKADLAVCATGWQKDPQIKFVNFGDAGIGLPQPPAEQVKLVTAADEKILSMFPRLKDQPKLNFQQSNDPFRLYRFMVPPTMVQDHNIAFAGMVSTVSTPICANTQALWISAFLDGKLDRLAKTDEEITQEVMLCTQWGKWRYPCGYGDRFPDFVFDAIPYTDLLLNDLGLKANRKTGMLADITEPYGPEDYVGLVDEWVESQRKE